MIRCSVSNLDKYAAYLDNEEYPLALLLQDLRGQTSKTTAMKRGHAFALAMEQLGQGCPQCHSNAPDTIIAEGHAFAFTCDAQIEAWPRRELKAEKDYGGIIVSARCDRIYGNIIADDKTTESFSSGGVERYIDKKQWRYYLDIFGAQEFVWYVWSVREIDVDGTPGVQHAWEVFACDVIRNYRYPGLEAECREFALEFKQFAERVGLYV